MSSPASSPDGLVCVPFTKMQGTGNDFMVVDAASQPPELDWPLLARHSGDRHTGVGHDGLLVVTQGDAAGGFRMRMFNPDGTEDMCGNGLRCVARYLVERGLSPTRELVIETLSGLRRAEVLADGRVRVQMGRVPLVQEGTVKTPAGGFRYVLLRPGTPHAVLLSEALPAEDVFQVAGPAIEHSPAFAEPVSVLWAVPEDRHTVRLRIWERSVGETLSCGTGACATAVAALRAGLVDEPVTVRSRGGELVVAREPTEPEAVTMTGPAAFVYEGRYRFAP